MGLLDSSFPVLPFGNDLMVVWLVARNHHGAPWYVLSAATGSTLGALALALVARKLGRRGISKLAGEQAFQRLQKRLSHKAIGAIALAALAPPPFPYKLVIAVASVLDRSLPEILLTNFIARGARFAILAYLAMKFGREVNRIIQSVPFRWSMVAFIAFCVVASGLTIWKWIQQARSVDQPEAYKNAIQQVMQSANAGRSGPLSNPVERQRLWRPAIRWRRH